MNQNEKKTQKLMQYGISSKNARILVDLGIGVTKLRNTNLSELTDIFKDVAVARSIKKAVKRQPIDDGVLQKLILESEWTCCFCWDIDKKQPVVIHHIEPYHRTQDNSYENLVVLCPNHHADAHSKSDLAGEILPASLIKAKKDNYILAIERAKKGLQIYPGREILPHYSLAAIKQNSHSITSTTLRSLSNKFTADLYVKRDIHRVFDKFVGSEKTCFVVADRSGQGKTNFVCAASSTLVQQDKVVIFLRVDDDYNDEDFLAKRIVQSLGYGADTYKQDIIRIAHTLKVENEFCYVFLDGLSESNTRNKVNRSLRNLLSLLSELQ